MPIMLAVATRPSQTLIPNDAMVNTFHFNSTGKVDGQNISDMIHDFYNACVDTITFRLYRRDYRLQIYDLSDPEPRVAWFDEERVSDSSNEAALPRECSMVITLGTAPISGVPPARRRGRLYIGGLAASAVAIEGRPTDTARERLCEAGAGMVAASQASVNHTWVVYSRTNEEGYPILGGGVDNSFDTQRRRGDQPTNVLQFSDVFPIP